MAKYIDLLRTHQKTNKIEPENSSPSAAKKKTPQIEESEDFNKSFEPLLAEETGEFEYLPPQEELLEDPLIVDDVQHAEPPSKMEEISTPNKQTSPIADKKWLMTCAGHVLQFFQHAQQKTPANITALSSCINEFLSKLEHDQKQNFMNEIELNIAQQTQEIRTLHTDLGSLVQKSIMMMLYATKAGQRLKLNTEELRSHTLAAMLHHVGMAQISSDIRHKKKKLSKSELAEIRQAPKYSHDFLEQCGITDVCILQAASQATERYDGSGTAGLSGSDIAWSARLTGVLSMFEALIHYRPYRERLLPLDAIREMVKNHKKSFDPAMLKALIESISLYPVGTYVKLNSSEVGLVVRIHHRLPLRPVVDIRMDSKGNPVPPRQVDLKAQPNLTVEQCMYEEALSSLGDKDK